MITKNKINKQKAKTTIEALAKYLECSKSDLDEKSYDYYGLEVFSLGKKEYAVGTDEEADKACAEYIKQTAWAFRPEFVASECGMPEAEEIIQAAQAKCEDSNDAILAIIKGSCGIASFVDSAISADGRGHFLAQYDGNENEQGNFYIYRIN